MWGKSVRYRSAESIYRELEYLAEHNVRNVLFLADLFTYDRKGVMKLCDLIIERGLKVRWTCNSRVDTIDEEMMVRDEAGRLLADRVRHRIRFAAGPGQRQERRPRRGRRRARSACATNTASRPGAISSSACRARTRQTVRETIDFAKSIPLDIALFHVAMPYAGTEFYFQAVANGWLNTSEWKHFDMNDSAVVQYEDFTAEDDSAGHEAGVPRVLLPARAGVAAAEDDAGRHGTWA